MNMVGMCKKCVIIFLFILEEKSVYLNYEKSEQLFLFYFVNFFVLFENARAM